MTKGPVPVATPESQPFWDGTAAGELRLPKCANGHVFFYPRTYCPECSSSDISWITASGKGVLSSYVINERPLPMFESPDPQIIALITLAEGPRMMSNIVDVEPKPENLPLDAPVSVSFIDRGDKKLPVFTLDK